ncbi:extracellular solute-binding protein [Maritimibacter sp. UBA3975]|uniref:ABC transporter substrate-binding protein n=1 Tax=Maritimibacter sp. UBA3975 TaxID=1946833 RepID=UPI000C0A8ACE|nr:extracellular solute-binding protein [Maritimibacter sp. UBA3975]MAM62946.1 sugar ABC transporter substrate-binding protein [Maritimibacter sp.]|tara:strand:+ start:34324 stop:35631 length:1308 start_codon:yes stop_codon:yes gene_type:complete
MKRLLLASTAATLFATGAQAQTTIELQRFFGACDADYGDVTDVSSAVGECGIITALINDFEAQNEDIDVEVTTVEWPGYDQLNAQLASRNAPDVVSMHYSVISDYTSRNLLEPLDDLLAEQGIETSSFTDAALAGVTKDGQIYALPFDNWTMLWHLNMNLMEEAGLVDDSGAPILPSNTDEFFEHAATFEEATGKPYLVQILANETAAYARLFYTFMLQQGADPFSDPTQIDLMTPEAKAVVEFLKKISDEGATTTDMDYAAAVAGFGSGEGGIGVNGTWLIGDYTAQSEEEGNALSDGYTVYPIPQLFATQDATYADGHGWAVPRNPGRDDDVTAAIGKLMAYLAENDFQWARTGHLPAVASVFEMDEFQSLPHRDNIAEVAQTGQSLNPQVLRQFSIQDIIGEEFNSAVHGDKTVDEALEAAQNRINDLLANL